MVSSNRLFGAKCTRCGITILPQEMVMRAQDYVYHLSCFMCVACGQPLQKGEQFVLRRGQLFCRPDYENEMLLLQQTSSPGKLVRVNINSNCFLFNQHRDLLKSHNFISKFLEKPWFPSLKKKNLFNAKIKNIFKNSNFCISYDSKGKTKALKDKFLILDDNFKRTSIKLIQ